jgi:demethylmenaquinone methyltransferase/2-methoxy-6-polyprenyl-1,4-benzoquinol methylase
MFDALVPDYDRFNRFSSLGLDAAWRRHAAELFEPASHVLDVGTGTGDTAKAVLDHTHGIVTGVDFSEGMISAARKKFDGEPRANFSVGAADNLPFDARAFDGVVSSFVIRNLHHGGVLPQALREFNRVLRPGGQMVHLELTRPPRGFLSWGHRMYLGAALPVIGRAVFGRRWPKNYLSSTIERFPVPLRICQQFRWAGFDKVRHYPLSFGVASLFVGVKC